MVQSLSYNDKDANMVQGMSSQERKEDTSIHIGGSNVNSPIMSGDFQDSVNLTYSGNTTTTTTNNITINKEYLDKMNPDYSASLQQLIDTINKKIEEENLSQQKVSSLQQTANEVAKELVNVKAGAPLTFEKRNEVNSKLARFAKAIAKASPTMARVVIGMTPLAPLAGLIGEGFDKVVREYYKEEEVVQGQGAPGRAEEEAR